MWIPYMEIARCADDQRKFNTMAPMKGEKQSMVQENEVGRSNEPRKGACFVRTGNRNEQC
jgi:hypothetical protein